MTNVEILKNLIRLFRENQVVERIAAAKGDICVYTWQRDKFKNELDKLSKQASYCGYIIKEDEYSRILTEDALQIAFICIMARIDDFQLLQIYEELPVALRKVKGELSNLAENIAYYLGPEGDGDKNMALSDHSENELLKLFFR